MPTKSDLDRWTKPALAIASDDPPPANAPLHVVLGEAVDVARFFTTYYEPQTKGAAPRRGLSSAVTAKSRINEKTGDEILSLQRAAQEAQTRYLLVVDPARGASPVDRGQFLLGELTATLEFLFDDGVDDENDAQLAQIDAAHADDPGTADALAGALDDYAALAEPHRADLDGLGGFEAAFIDEAREVAATLRARPATPGGRSDEAKQAIALRNKVLTLLADRVDAVRSAARFVFRGRPEIIREATSTYERRRRAAARRAKAKKPVEKPAPPPA